MKNQRALEARFGATFDFEFHPRYNAAPSQELPVILNHEPDKIQRLTWGLAPKWIESVKKSGRIINVRAETLREKSTFKSNLKNNRCLAIADGFYEWKNIKGGKIPYFVTRKDGEPFAFPCIYEGDTFSIITTKPNSLLEKIHNRMPVILSPDEERLWLEGDNLEELLGLLDSISPHDLKAYEISTYVNSTENETPDLIEPV